MTLALSFSFIINTLPKNNHRDIIIYDKCLKLMKKLQYEYLEKSEIIWKVSINDKINMLNDCFNNETGFGKVESMCIYYWYCFSSERFFSFSLKRQ